MPLMADKMDGISTEIYFVIRGYLQIKSYRYLEEELSLGKRKKWGRKRVKHTKIFAYKSSIIIEHSLSKSDNFSR